MAAFNTEFGVVIEGLTLSALVIEHWASEDQSRCSGCAYLLAAWMIV
ncbi:MAG TPA: hypothetical protein ACN46Q_06625 [Prochlorococcus sp.]|jgi:hypothetical protein